MYRSSSLPMPRFATPDDQPAPKTATLPPSPAVRETSEYDDLPRTLTHEDLLLRVPPAPRATQLTAVPVTFEAPTAASRQLNEGAGEEDRLTEDDIALLRHIAETPDAHGCHVNEGTVIPRELLLALLGELEAKSARAAGNASAGATTIQLDSRPDTRALEGRITALVRQAFHDAFIAVGGSLSLLIIGSVFDASQVRVELDRLIDQMRAGEI